MSQNVSISKEKCNPWEQKGFAEQKLSTDTSDKYFQVQLSLIVSWKTKLVFNYEHLTTKQVQSGSKVLNLTSVVEDFANECMKTRLGHFCEQQREKCLFLHDLILEMRSDVIHVCVFTIQKMFHHASTLLS